MICGGGWLKANARGKTRAFAKAILSKPTFRLFQRDVD